MFKVLYAMFIRLEFALQAWCPHLKNDINALEKVQPT
jgi:hypothetical protein